ncbi:MAG: low molecular weight protein-tyrosine-phosphatase [Bdellovibrionales bacterium]
MVKVLFVCMGNICRSPAAEGTMKSLIQKHNLSDHVYCESAGTSAHHVGQPADERMRTHALKRGLNLESLAQQFKYEHFMGFDYILTMDTANYKNVLRLDPEGQFTEKVIPFYKLCHKFSINEVPDPYYGGSSGFEAVLDIVEDGCRGFLDRFELLKYEGF